MKINDKIQIIIASLTTLLLVACGTTTKVIEYDANGNIIKTTESDSSDFASYIASSTGNATFLYGDVSKINLGWNGYGLNWLSISGGRLKAPAKESESTFVLE